jgi:hypothetical protein
MKFIIYLLKLYLYYYLYRELKVKHLSFMHIWTCDILSERIKFSFSILHYRNKKIKHNDCIL